MTYLIFISHSKVAERTTIIVDEADLEKTVGFVAVHNRPLTPDAQLHLTIVRQGDQT